MNDWVFGTAVSFEDGRYRVRVRDLPEAVTSAAKDAEAMAQAVDAIQLSIAFRMTRGEALPVCSAVLDGERPVTMSAKMTAKAAVYAAWLKAGISKSELARRMGRDVVEVRRILEPGHGTKIEQLDEAARALGGRLAVSFAGP